MLCHWVKANGRNTHQSRPARPPLGQNRHISVRLYSTSTTSVVWKNESRIARCSIPDEIVFNQDQQFTSAEFQQIEATYGIGDTFTSPCHHQANRKAEIADEQAKKILKMVITPGRDPYLALLDYAAHP